MKYLYRCLYIFLNVLVVLSIVQYPISRDDFYYLDKSVNSFEESYNSYFVWVARLGQFVCGYIERNTILIPIFGFLLFNGFFLVLFLLIIRRLPKLSDDQDFRKLLIFSSAFFVIMGYFGVMFYYKPYSTNYTFPLIFYMLIVYIISEFFIYNQKFKNYNILTFIIIGFFAGMCNEHVPPVILGLFALLIIFKLVKTKEISYKILVLWISTFLGYCFLFFAPANRMRAKKSNVKYLEYNFDLFFHKFKEILNIYYYRNLFLILALVISFALFLYFRKKYSGKDLQQICLTLILGFGGVAICLFSPLIGRRLLFFATTMFIVSIFLIFRNLKDFSWVKILSKFLIVVNFILVSMGLFFILNAKENSLKILSEIVTKSKLSKVITLEKSFDFYYKGDQFKRIYDMIFIDRGDKYLDNDPSKDTSVERNIKMYYKIDTIKTSE